MPPDDGSRAAIGWRARLELAFERRGARSVLAHRRHEGPLVVQKALYPEGEGACHAIVVHPPAGIAGGDDIALSIDVAHAAHALITTPGAGKWYRSSGAWARQRSGMRIADGACLEWLPQETILYDASRAEISWEADLANGARLIAWDIYCLGRTASGESYARGEARVETRVRRGGRLAWLERAHLDAGMQCSAAGLAGRTVFGTLLASAPAIEPAWIAACREENTVAGECAVTAVPSVLVARYRGDSSEAARRYFAALWRRLREPLLGRAACEPRIWRT
ncbi:MAG TPA: urease accessory protein UreD [Usitatibacter sp.]|nr:urease accessory protein UreD [Usitatibacter sp.]